MSSSPNSGANSARFFQQPERGAERFDGIFELHLMIHCQFPDPLHAGANRDRRTVEGKLGAGQGSTTPQTADAKQLSGADVELASL